MLEHVLMRLLPARRFVYRHTYRGIDGFIVAFNADFVPPLLSRELGGLLISTVMAPRTY
jgi:hypothetical protein